MLLYIKPYLLSKFCLSVCLSLVALHVYSIESSRFNQKKQKKLNKLKFAVGEEGLSAEPVRALSRAGRAESRSLYVWLAPLTSTMTAPS